jgi:lantibiotic modifying enzyme
MRNDHSFRPGKKFLLREGATAEDYLAAVIKTHNYLEKFRVSTPDGDYWVEPGENRIDLGFENGSAGITFFYLELYKVTGDSTYLEIVRSGLRYLAVHWREHLINSTDNENVKVVKHYELNTSSGVGSIAELFLKTYNTFRDDVSKNALREIAREVVATQTRHGEDVYWMDYPAYCTGDSGIAVLLLKISGALGDEELRKLAIKAGKTVLKSALPDVRGGKVLSVIPQNFPAHAPNFTVGTSGIAYALSVLYDGTKEKEFLEYAEAGAEYLRAISVKKGDGALVPVFDDGNDLFFVGWCHGPPGTSRVFYQLYRSTGDEKYKDFIEEMVRGIEDIGAPETQSNGYWNNTNICCGTSALLQFFISLYLAFGDEKYLALAGRSAKIVLGEAEEIEPDAVGWPLASMLSDRDSGKVTIEKGYLHGGAGIACALLQYYQILSGTAFRWDRLMDDPFPAKI